LSKTPKSRSNFEEILDRAGFKSALPYCVISGDGALQFANQRMSQILQIPADNQDIKTLDIRQLWPFFNQEKSAVAVYNWLLTEEAVGAKLSVEASLKNFLLHVLSAADGQRIVVAELLREGDLLEDAEARQTLFRSMSHEIRTSTTSLQGYLDILEKELDQELQIKILDRMKVSLNRLHNVVQRLGDFKNKLED